MDKVRAVGARWVINNQEKKLLKSAQSKASTKGLEINIELSDIVIPEVCPVLGIKLDGAAGRLADGLPSLDRIDSSKGYVKGNVWVISWKANKLKAHNTLETLRALTRALERLY